MWTKIVYYYSRVPNKRVGWNKRVGGKILEKVINVQVGINVQEGNFGKIYEVFQLESWCRRLIMSSK